MFLWERTASSALIRQGWSTIQICIGMHMNLDETQTALKIAKYAPLYPKDERDSIILFGIEKKQSLVEINTALYDHGFKCLCET